MADSILVAYASWAGSTGEVAEAVAEGLRGTGANVEVAAARDVDGLDGYGAVILGTGIRAGRVHADATGFLRRHRGQLAGLVVAYFVVCMTMKEDTPENRTKAEGFLSGLTGEFSDVVPIDIGLFGGAIPSGDGLKRLSFGPRLLARMMKSAAGDFRDWKAIAEWSSRVGAAIGGGVSEDGGPTAA